MQLHDKGLTDTLLVTVIDGVDLLLPAGPCDCWLACTSVHKPLTIKQWYISRWSAWTALLTTTWHTLLAAPDLRMVPAAAAAAAECVAESGYGWPGCTMCSIGTYSEGGTAACTDCPEGKTTPWPGSTTDGSCNTCKPGYGGLPGCTKCSDDGKYGVGGYGDCFSCPAAGSKTPPNSVATTSADCTCE